MTPPVTTEQTLSPVVACALSSDDLGTQAERWKTLRTEAGIDRIETGDGLRMTFRDEPAAEKKLRLLVGVENECCAWASWRVSRDDGVLVMRVSSTGAGIATLHAMFADGPAVAPR